MLMDCDSTAIIYSLSYEIIFDGKNFPRGLCDEPCFFSPPSPQHLGDSQNTSSFKESLEVGCLGRNIIIFSSSVACSRMGRTSSFLCFVYCFISDELPSMTVLKLSNLFFIGIHVTITMQPFMPLKKMKLGYPNILSHLGIFIYS